MNTLENVKIPLNPKIKNTLVQLSFAIDSLMKGDFSINIEIDEDHEPDPIEISDLTFKLRGLINYLNEYFITCDQLFDNLFTGKITNSDFEQLSTTAYDGKWKNLLLKFETLNLEIIQQIKYTESALNRIANGDVSTTEPDSCSLLFGPIHLATVAINDILQAFSDQIMMVGEESGFLSPQMQDIQTNAHKEIWSQIFTLVNMLGSQLKEMMVVFTHMENQLDQHKWGDKEIAQRKLAEELLKSEKDFISAIINTTGFLIIAIDPTGRVVKFNKSCEFTSGFNNLDVMGRFVWESLIPDENVAPMKFAFKEGLYEEFFGTHREEYWLCKDGSSRIISWSHAFIYDKTESVKFIIGTGIDVTEKKNIEAVQASQAIELARYYNELEDKEKIITKEKEKAEMYLNIANVIILAIGTDRKVSLINDKGCELLGWTKDFLLGKDWFAIAIPDKLKEMEIERFQSSLQEEVEEHKHFESVIKTQNGIEKVISWNYSILTDTEGSVIGTLNSGEDITKQKEIDIMKTELINTVSHEIRTPLASILGFTELMLKRDLDMEKRTKYLKTMYNESKRLMHLVNDFLDIQRMESGRMVLENSTFCMQELMQEVLLIFSEHKTHQTEFESPDEPIQATADFNKLKQLMTNLVSNAIKYSPGADHFRVTLSLVDADQLKVVVKDFGIGISSEHLEKMFTKFFRVDSSEHRKVGGTGLGLAICKEIVEAHGGKIWIDTEYGVGSEFIFTMPLIQR